MNNQSQNAIDLVLAESLKELAIAKPIEKITIKEITDKEVVLDFNHPLAGKTLHFDVEIKEIN